MSLRNNLLGTYQPDILDTIANLSNDEIFTPPHIANQALDLLPDHVWHEPNYRWLDPGCKTGVFLREVARRLMVGLTEAIPDETHRREHIFRNMLFGLPITALTAEVSRRTVYYTKDATNADHSVVVMGKAEGNLPLLDVQHTFRGNSCAECHASDFFDRGADRESHAYAFIHPQSAPLKGVFDMKFNVIVGNPPYHITIPGTSDRPLYHEFVQQAISLEPDFVSMIIPSRWFAGGKYLDGFRAEMLKDKRLREMVDFPDATDCFPGVPIKGGVCFFLWDKNHSGVCNMRTVRGGTSTERVERALDEFDVFVRDPEALPILKKVRSFGEPTVDGAVSGQTPFGFHTNFLGNDQPNDPSDIVLHLNARGQRKTAWVARSSVTRNSMWVDEWKVLLPKAGSDGGVRLPNIVLGKPIVAGPGTCCTQTYLVGGPFPTESAAINFESYAKSRFFRFLVSLRKISQDAGRTTYSFVPQLDMSRAWTDADLYERYGITAEEQAFIESRVKEMP